MRRLKINQDRLASLSYKSMGLMVYQTPRCDTEVYNLVGGFYRILMWNVMFFFPQDVHDGAAFFVPPVSLPNSHIRFPTTQKV